MIENDIEKFKSIILKHYPKMGYSIGNWDSIPLYPFFVIDNVESDIDQSNQYIDFAEVYTIAFVDSLKNHEHNYVKTLTYLTNVMKDVLNKYNYEGLDISNISKIEKIRIIEQQVDTITIKVNITI